MPRKKRGNERLKRKLQKERKREIRELVKVISRQRMSREFEVVAVKQENMIDGYVPNSQPSFPHRVEPTVSDYLPERNSVTSPILEIGTIVGNHWTKNSSDPNIPNESNVMGLKKGPSDVTDLKIYACDVCEYRTRQKQSLVLHQRNHTGEKPYACPHCSYRTGKPGNMTVHVRKHTGEKPYACDQCEYRGTQRISLINHKKTHTGEKPFFCDVCDYRTGFRGNLSQHKRKHTGEKPFACGQCDYKSSQRTPWMAHLKKRHGNGPFICDICRFSSDVVEELAEHRKTHGPQLGPDETSTVQEFINLNPLLPKSADNTAATKFERWSNQERSAGGGFALFGEGLPCEMISPSKPSPYETVEAFNTTLRWAADNAKTMEEIELLRRMRHRALEQHLDNSLTK